MGRKDFTGDQLLEDMATHMADELSKMGIARDDAQKTAIDVTEVIRRHWGGQVVYITKDKSAKLKTRDTQIVREFTGDNYRDLAVAHGLSEMRIRQVINRERSIARRPL